MSLDVSLLKIKTCPHCGEPIGGTEEVFWANITHNLGTMAEAAGIYGCVWTPEKIGIEKASDLVEPLRDGIVEMEGDPDKYKQFDSENAWGCYEQFIPWLREYLKACIENPDCVVSVSR